MQKLVTLYPFEAIQDIRRAILDQEPVYVPEKKLREAFSSVSDSDLDELVYIFDLTKRCMKGMRRVCGNPMSIHSFDTLIEIFNGMNLLRSIRVELKNPGQYLVVAMGHDLGEDINGIYDTLNYFSFSGCISPETYFSIRLLSKKDMLFHPDYKQAIEYDKKAPGKYLDNYRRYLEDIINEDKIRARVEHAKGREKEYDLPDGIDIDNVDVESIVDLCAVAKLGDAIDNIRTATALRNSIYVPLRQKEPDYVFGQGDDPRKDQESGDYLHMDAYIKQINKTKVVLDVFSKYYKQIKGTDSSGGLVCALLHSLYVETLGQIDKEIERTGIELNSKMPNWEKLEKLKELISEESLRMKIVRDRYEKVKLQDEVEYLALELKKSLIEHRDQLSGLRNEVYENIQGGYDSFIRT
ncbi:hypothetical protein JXC34_05150 [Candidatus Woesearchaeota archaeon]|nr:hypothetical protein [Candidatus Woesearchaeota archaeon]